LISYDKDRQSNSFTKNIKKKCKVEKFFGFKKDFESSFPPKILKYAIECYIEKYTKSKIELTIKDIENLFLEQQPF